MTATTNPTENPAKNPARNPAAEPAEWRLDDLTRQRARTGIALARRALQESVERRRRAEADGEHVAA